MKTIELNIKGIHCGSCKMLIEDALGDLEGVEHSIVDSETGKTKVEFDETKVDEAKIKAEIESLGEYKVE